MNEKHLPRVCLIYPRRGTASETFIRNQERWLREQVPVEILWGADFPLYREDGSLLDGDTGHLNRFKRSWQRRILGVEWDHFRKTALARFLTERKVNVVIAEFAPVGVEVMDVCSALGIPLVVYFRGADAGLRRIVDYYGPRYPDLIRGAAAVITVSADLRSQVMHYGVFPEKMVVIPSGTNTDFFAERDVANSSPDFLFVGRFVEKKAPALVLLAFAKAVRQISTMRLTMIGDGPLLETCRQLAYAMKVDDKVCFKGEIASCEAVRDQFQMSRGLIHHAVHTSDGDREGTPNAVVEAGACGLPVVATRHGGIAEVVLHGETGFLVEEYDVDGMAEYMVRLAQCPELAAKLGRAAKQRIETYYSLEVNMQRLLKVIMAVAQGNPIAFTDGAAPRP